MEDLKQTGQKVEKRVTTFLSNKPMWVWLATYVVIVGVLFLLFYLIYTMLTVKWWVSVLIIIVAGIIWGSISYGSRKPDQT